MNPEEALAGVTCNSAAAQSLQDHSGALEEPGKEGDSILWDISKPAELAYYLAFNPCRKVIRQGKIVRDRESSKLRRENTIGSFAV